jgi:2-C-methyl-D-erythritol 4-phosphate cytidylyltransferase
MAGADKIFVSLGGRPLVSHSLQTLHDWPSVQEIVLVLSEAVVERGLRLVEASGWHKVTQVCAGGRRRQDSVRNGLERLEDSDWVIVHDGARPFIDEDLVQRGLAEAERTGTAIPALPSTDTVKSVDGQGFVIETLSRERVWVVQTPQVFKRSLLAEAHRLVREDATDDASMIERTGGRVRVFSGSYQNIKVTTPEDLAVAEAILEERQSTNVRSTP